MARCLRCKAGNEWIEGDVRGVDPQREGRQLHRYRSRIAALTKALEDVRWLLVPLMHAEDPKANEAVGVIDKALNNAADRKGVR